MQKDDLAPVWAKKAAQVLNRAYRRLKVKSWGKVAAKYGLSKSKAYMIAKGQRQPNPETDAALMRAVLRESDAARAPVKTRRLIRRVALPFLEKRQRSKRGLYGAGGRPV
jgi:hypothetical protein